MSRELTPSIRQPQSSNRFKTFLIIMEGEKQEPNYFNTLKKFYTRQHRESRITIKIVKRKEEQKNNSSPSYLIQLAKEFSNQFDLQKYDELWMVFDADSWGIQAFEELNHWKNEENYHYLAYSNPCFELWLILHLTEYQTIQKRVETAKIRIRSRICKQIHGELKQDNKLSGEYIEYLGDIQQAIERAKALDITPEKEFPNNICTRVYQLVEKLTTLPKKIYLLLTLIFVTTKKRLKVNLLFIIYYLF
ncbi:abortive phage resistance protein [Beggiatoa sp. PS]|nr:abortive phage resistance protein [Beggiatoa sp. PS]